MMGSKAAAMTECLFVRVRTSGAGGCGCNLLTVDVGSILISLPVAY